MHALKTCQVNAAVLKDNGLVNKKAETDGADARNCTITRLIYDAGWLLKVAVGGSVDAELGALLTPAKYEELCHAAH